MQLYKYDILVYILNQSIPYLQYLHVAVHRLYILYTYLMYIFTLLKAVCKEYTCIAQTSIPSVCKEYASQTGIPFKG